MADETSSPPPRVPLRQAGLVAAVALAGAVLLFAIWYVVLRTPYIPVFSGLRSNDAATIVGELDRLKIPYRLDDDGSTVLVPEDQADGVRVAILGSDLPLKGAVGFELFNKSDMGLTEFAQKINYQRALQGELARTIMALEEVDTARVHLSLPESGIFEQNRRPAKASVTIATKMGGSVDASVVRGVQQLVASAVPELQAASVSILDARGRLLSAPPPTPLTASSTDQRRLALEEMYSARIRAALSAAGMAMPLAVTVTSFGAIDDTMLAGSDPDAGVPAEPAPRRAALRITLLVGSEPGPAIRERMLAATRQAIAFDEALGDVIGLQVDPMLGAPPPAPVAAGRPVPRAEAPAAAAGLPSLWPWLLAALAIVAAGIVVLRTRRQAMAGPSETPQAFAARLKGLLAEEDRRG